VWKIRQDRPLRRVYDLRDTFATFALRAGISAFDLSRYIGACLTMIDRRYGQPSTLSLPSPSPAAQSMRGSRIDGGHGSESSADPVLQRAGRVAGRMSRPEGRAAKPNRAGTLAEGRRLVRL
jgi:hypothetical protein